MAKLHNQHLTLNGKILACPNKTLPLGMLMYIKRGDTELHILTIYINKLPLILGHLKESLVF